MQGISSSALNFGKQNDYKFNGGTELNIVFDINLYETNYRSLDPQVGRFWQIDPLAEFAYDYSPYCYGNNSPVLLNDPLGLQSDSTVKPSTPPPCNGPDCPTGKMAEIKELQPVSLSTNNSSSGGNVEKMITILGWLGLGVDYYKEMIHKGDWLYRNSKGVIQSIFDTKWGSDKSPKNLGNIKRYSNNAQKGIRATKAVKIIKTGGKIIILVSVAADVYNVFTAYKNNDSNADAILAKAGINTTMAGVGFIPGGGWVVSGIYFVIDATIGWDNAIPSYVEMEENKTDMRKQNLTNFSDFKFEP